MHQAVEIEDLQEEHPLRQKLSKRVFTTLQISKICRVSIQTIIRAIDKGKLRAHRVPNDKKRIKGPRRVLGENLFTFIEEQKMLGFVSAVPPPTKAEEKLPRIIPGMDKNLRTGHIAKICGISISKAIGLFDDAFIDGFEKMKGAHRRIAPESLLKFLVTKFKWNLDEIALRTGWQRQQIATKLQEIFLPIGDILSPNDAQECAIV